ncbi:MAG: amidohydrolase family protein [Phycisphaerales bacterium]|nr:amidohydrolase family protein [Planctomycetota bacterium]MBL6998092.1 amidohydrolase family protein [Phycisphaerales bacterium]
MIIDCHTRLWSDARQLGPSTAQTLMDNAPRSWAEPCGDASAHGRAMSCIDASLVLGHRADLVGAHVPNELIADFVSRDSQRRFGIAGIDPLADSVDQDFAMAINLGLVGIAVSPSLAGFNPTHSSAMRIYERCCEHNLPVIVTMPQPIPAAAVLDFARPVHWDEVARTYPELRILFTQMGFPWIDEMLVLAGKHQHVFAEVSCVAMQPLQVYNTLSTAWSLDVIDRLLFGSGFPYSTPQLTIESLYSVNVSIKGTAFPPIPRARVKEIVERDSLACLGIPNTSVSTKELETKPVQKKNTVSKDDS